MLDSGFITALGTPLDETGAVVASSLSRHVEDQVEHGAAGLLVMGSMGMQAMIRQSEYAKVARVAAEAAGGKCPVYVGVMDNSIARVRDRIAVLSGLPIDGVVATTPFYHVLNQQEVYAFFVQLAAGSPFPVYMYDLPGVTKTKITTETAARLMSVPNMAGIKTGDLAMARVLHRMSGDVAPGFAVLFSGLDVFDVAYGYGLSRQLDGMFACTVSLTQTLYERLEAGDAVAAGRCLDHMLELRNLFLEVGLSGAFTLAMNVLGFPGYFGADYSAPLTEAGAVRVKETIRRIGLVP